MSGRLSDLPKRSFKRGVADRLVEIGLRLAAPAIISFGPCPHGRISWRRPCRSQHISRVVCASTNKPAPTAIDLCAGLAGPESLSAAVGNLLNMSETEVGSQPQLDVRAIPPVERHPRIFGIAQALAEGQSFVIVNDHDPRPLRYQMEARYPGLFDWEYLQQGPDIWRVEIKRLQSGCDCCCGG